MVAGLEQTSGRGPKREFCDDDGDRMEDDVHNAEGTNKRCKQQDGVNTQGTSLCVWRGRYVCGGRYVCWVLWTTGLNTR